MDNGISNNDDNANNNNNNNNNLSIPARRPDLVVVNMKNKHASLWTSQFRQISELK